MGLFDGLSKLMGGVVGIANAAHQSKGAESDYGGRLDRADRMANASQTADRAPTFRRAESPVARAYLQQFLMGNNQDGISSTRFGAGADKAAAAKRFDQMTGGWNELQLKEKAEADPNRYALQGPRARYGKSEEQLQQWKLDNRSPEYLAKIERINRGQGG